MNKNNFLFKNRTCFYIFFVIIFLFVVLPFKKVESANTCDTSYPFDYFRGCFYEGINLSGAFVDFVEEPALTSPAPENTWAIDHNWGNGVILNGRYDNISGVWRGKINFPNGRYQFTVQTDDGVRLYINEQLIIDEWRDQEDSFAAGIDLNGYTNIRIEWYENSGNAKLHLHWNKVPKSPATVVSPVQVDFFIISQLNTCIVGNPAVSANRFTVFNADGTVFKSFELDNVLTSLRPSDPKISQYVQNACLSLSLSPTEQTRIKENVERVFQNVKNRHTLGAFDITVRTITLGSVEANLSRWGGFWLASWDLQPLVSSHLSKQTDFVIATHGMNEYSDGKYGKYINPPACGGTFGADIGVGGAGYSWVPQTKPGNWYECSTYGVYINEWLHQLEWAIPNLMGLNDIYVDDATGQRTYPPCGTYDPDTYKWFPGNYDLASEHGSGDPDSPWCGTGQHPGADPGSAHLFLSHFDFSMQHYSSPVFNGNHCADGKQNFSETAVDTGGNCPGAAGGDITPPLRSNGFPSSPLPAGTTQTTISLTTNESATCKYGTTAGTSYSSLPNTFSTTGGTSYSSTITGLTNGASRTYYVRCQDTAGNMNTDDFIISFSVNSGTEDITPSVRSNGAPTGTLSAGTTQATISLNTTENATCRYSVISGTSYGSMQNIFSTTGGTSHSKVITGLTNGTTYNYYVRCQDTAGNVNSDDYLISFSVAIGKEGEEPTSQMSIEELQARIAQLLAQIAALKAQLGQTQGVSEIPTSYRFTKPLYFGLRNNNDIRYLQMFLKNQGTDIYPEGLITGYFGLKTREAVIRFQIKQGVVGSRYSSGIGLVGIKTRAKINDILGR